MRNLIFVVVGIGALAAVGCGGGDDSGGGPDITFTDAAVNDDVDAGSTEACNAVANTGCDPGQKCTFIIESSDPTLGRTACAPDGDKGAGDACTFDNGDLGVDDCMGGFGCQNGFCKAVCTTAPDSCGTDATCVHVNNIFEDDNLGYCDPPCDIWLQDCANDEVCYILITRPGAPTICAPERMEDGQPGPGTQGIDCNFINTCKKGYGCLLNNMPMDATGLECAFLCDASNTGGPTCAVDGPGPAFSCRQINMFYQDAVDVPDDVGFCVDPLEYPEM